MIFTKKLACRNEYFKKLEDYEKSIEELLKPGKEACFSKVGKKCHNQEEIDRKNEVMKLFIIKNGRELTELYNKADAIRLADIFEKFIKVSISEFGINLLHHK